MLAPFSTLLAHDVYAAQVVHSRMLLRPGDVGALGRTMQSVPGVLDYLGVATHKTKFVVVPQPDGPDNIEVLRQTQIWGNTTHIGQFMSIFTQAF